MSADNLPSGRERAIETLVDMEPYGSFYRATRVLEESVPQALLQRPNLVTKSALVEQAYSLSKFELDQLGKYDAVFGDPTFISNDHLEGVSISHRDRILKHHSKILAAKRGTKQHASKPALSPQLVAALRHVYGEEESLELLSLLQSVMERSAFESSMGGVSASPTPSHPEDSTSSTISSAYPLECLIHKLGENAKLHGLLITVLSMVTNYEIQKEESSSTTTSSTKEEQTDPISPPPLQVGSILSIVRPEDEDNNPWSLDMELLSYLGQAAALYEERIEIQKERLLSKLGSVSGASGAGLASSLEAVLAAETPKATVVEESSTETPAAATPAAATVESSESDVGAATARAADTPAESGSETPDAVAVREDDVVIPDDTENEIEAAAAALSAAVFESIISQAARGGGDGTVDGDDSSDDSSEDGEDSDYEDQGLGDDGSSSSSSSSSSSGMEGADDGQPNQPHGDSEDDDDDLEEEEEVDAEDANLDEDMVLRQALVLSLAEQASGGSLRVDTAGSASELDILASPILSPGPITPGTETPVSKKGSYSPIPEPDEESPLPSIPPPPKVYPYSHLFNTSRMDSDQFETESRYFDPAALNRFGSLPAPHVLIHLLRFTLETIERRKFYGREESGLISSSSSRLDVARMAIAGGMGSSLFPPSHQFLKSQRPSQDTGNEIAISLQMLVSLFLLVHDRRQDAIAKLHIALQQEHRASETDCDETKRDMSKTASAEEGDDPAIALALHYFDDEGESKESLEAKGMRRKAAAAAHDAAVVLDSLRRRTASWKQQVALFSQCTLISMKCLHMFLQYIVRRWLQERQSLSATSCHDLIPKSVVAKLLSALETFFGTRTKPLGPALGAEDTESDETFSSLRLYQCALLLWGEVVPILYPTVASQTETIRSLLLTCSKTIQDAPYRSMEKLTALPFSRAECAFHQLHVLCRRLRVTDLLDSFVSSPACYLPHEGDDTIDTRQSSASVASPQLASSLIALIWSVSSSIGGLSGELYNLYLAICHRCHTRILLWDGLYACSDLEVEEAALSLVASAGDTVRVNTNASDTLVFDGTKCSDSMSIVPNQGEGGHISSVNGSAVNQRASKVWGSVLSSCSFSPKTGVHRWAVRLDKCERGHVFIGVSTAQASTRTYVGGDKYGWGMIGTQALWHDRRKILGDYGATFRTGSTIVVTLDTDAGTLSFSSWKDNSASNSFALDPVVQNSSSPRRHAHVGGAVEDWGIAFEGLPLDSRLYPAVGLYQRDDRVTILTIESGKVAPNKETLVDLSGGLCYYPRVTSDGGSYQQVESVQRFNNLLSWDGIEYAAKIMEDAVHGLEEGSDEALFSALLPGLASSLCLLPPTIPLLSQRFALVLLPKLSQCILRLEKLKPSPSKQAIFSNGLQEGKWIIRATSSSGSSSDAEEYVVDINAALDDEGNKIGFEGSGVGTTGKSKNGLVAIFGISNGSSIYFVEDWSDGGDEGFSSVAADDSSSSCVVSARISIDGKKFEGHYRNVQFGTSGQIAGLLLGDDRKVPAFRLKEAPVSSRHSIARADCIETGKVLLSLAHSHLASILAEDAAGDFSFPLQRPQSLKSTECDWNSRYGELKRCLALPIVLSAFSGMDEDGLAKQSKQLLEFYSPPVQTALENEGDRLHLFKNDASISPFMLQQYQSSSYSSLYSGIRDAVSKAEDRTSGLLIGDGALAILSKPEYGSARQSLICALIHLCGLSEEIIGLNKQVPATVDKVWTGAQKIIESGVRSAVAEKHSEMTAREKAREKCLLYEQIAEFLLTFEVTSGQAFAVETAVSDASKLFRIVKSSEDLNCIKEEVSRSTSRGLLRFVSIRETLALMSELVQNDSPGIVEALASGIPRLLGRGYTNFFNVQDRQDEWKDPSGLGSHYLTNLPGLSSAVASSIQQCVHDLWERICDILVGLNADLTKTAVDQTVADSMTLTLFSSFTAAMRTADVNFAVTKTPLLKLLASAFERRRDKAHVFPLTLEDDFAASSAVKELHEIGSRELSRTVLRLLMGTSHILCYQALTASNSSSTGNSGLGLCLDFMLKELIKTTTLVQDSFVHAAGIYHNRLGDGQWEKWLEESTKDLAPKTPRARSKRIRRQVGLSGIHYLQENGSSHFTLSQATTQKSQQRNRSAPNGAKGNPDNPAKLQTYFSHQLFTHWLHLVAAASKTSPGKMIISAQPPWMSALLAMIGLSEDSTGSERFAVPARYRARILRILFPFLEIQEASVAIVRSLFRLAGKTSLIVSINLDEDESIVSREAVSLLRRLHAPRLEAWRATINEEMSIALLSSLRDPSVLAMKLGVILFFNGGVEGINRGSFVLLKPAAAAPLSAEQQATPSSKGQSGSSGGPSFSSTPHHVVGNGTEGIISGLCRGDASAGIVSSVDAKNSFCEVVLLNRESKETQEGHHAPSSTFRKSGGGSPTSGSSSTRHTLTVRAVRSPLVDIAHAQEVGLYLDERVPIASSLGIVLREALDIQARLESSSSKEKQVDTMQADLIEGTYSAMVLRGAITALSNDRILNSFLQVEPSRALLSSILRLSCMDQSKSSNDAVSKYSPPCLSSLPIHEARWMHMAYLFRGLLLRNDLIEKTPECAWQSRLDEYNGHIHPFQPDMLSPTASGVPDGYTTPPLEPGTTTDIPPVLGTRSSNQVGAVEGVESPRTADTAGRSSSQSTTPNDISEDDDDSEAAATAAAHLREAAIAQMAELGLPRSWSELALRRTGGTNIEAAVHFCLERGGDMERLLLEERERERMMQRQSSGNTTARRRGNRGETSRSSHLLRQLMEMGFPSRWCAEALAATGNNVDEALTWILTNGERLSAEDAGMEDGDDDDDIEDDDDDDDDEEEEEETQGDEESDGVYAAQTKEEPQNLEATTEGNGDSSDTGRDAHDQSIEVEAWKGSVIPLRFISGRSIIDSKTLSISGLPTGGFSSVGTKGVLLTSGKWYYEAILETAGCLQIGWADGSFAGHCHADRGDGCGDGPSSWAYDGWRRYRWHATATEWGCRWKEGDVIGCMVDMDENSVSFTLNGRGEEIGMGLAFSGQGFRPCGGVYACVSFNRREKLRIILGGKGSEPFKHSPPPGYLGVGEAVLDAVQERDFLIAKEKILDEALNDGASREASKEELDKRFLCDFSDGEHGHELMAWAHRYYGSDASVHLGSSRSKSGLHKGSGNASPSQDMSITQCVNRRVEKAWQKYSNTESSKGKIDNVQLLKERVAQGYIDVAALVREQTIEECRALSTLYARKLLLHMIIIQGENFDPELLFLSDNPKIKSAARLWKIVEENASLQSVGWVGEAGSMAVAAEALGLGISSNDSLGSRSLHRVGSTVLADLDEGITFPGAGIVQVLSSITEGGIEGESIATSCNFVASAEASIASNGGGVLVFLRKGLQGALCRSTEFREIVIASIRRSIRLLSVVEYDGEDSSPSESPEEDDVAGPMIARPSSSGSDSKEDASSQGDARLVSYLTGLLLHPKVACCVANHDEVKVQLFEAWSIGMLSASLPWRMVCAFTASGVLNICPRALQAVVVAFPTLCRFYGRLLSTVARRTWAERAAAPVCSRYTQAMIELLSSVRRAVATSSLPDNFMRFWNRVSVDASTPLPLPKELAPLASIEDSSWESNEGWMSSDDAYDVWTGTVKMSAVEWKTPSRSAVRTLMDGGDGPPMLREGCIVMRGLDWDNGTSNSNEDGKDTYEREKAKRDTEKQATETKESKPSTPTEDDPCSTERAAPDETNPATAEPSTAPSDEAENKKSAKEKKGKKKKVPSPKLPLGTVLSIEPWNGIPGMARRVRWHLTGEEGIYRYGGDGGRYDISHVEVNEKSTRVRKRHPLPESAEQCAARHGFGLEKRYSVLVRLKKTVSEIHVALKGKDARLYGIMEWPDFGAGIFFECVNNSDGSLAITEKELVYGAKDSGWEARFGQPSFVPGTTVVLSPVESSGPSYQPEIDAKFPYASMYEELLGNTTYDVPNLRNRDDGGKLRVTSEFRLSRSRKASHELTGVEGATSPMPPPLNFDRDYHAPSLSLSRDGRTVSCVSSDGRGTAFASMGFTKGVHYWEVKLEQADIGSVFIGVAEKPTGNGSGSSYGYDTPPRLNRWHGWGFVNFRATYTAGAERIYGAHCHAGDTVGVLLDCDAGRLSFFFDGLKYGEHILNDLGCAFENLSPFGFNVDGCGSGGAGQGAPSAVEGGRSGRYPAQGAVRPKALWPVIGLRNQGDRVTISSKWSTNYGVDGVSTVKNALALDEILHVYTGTSKKTETQGSDLFPDWFLAEAFVEYRRWVSGSWCRSATRGSGPYEVPGASLEVELDSSPLACASASALLGMKHPLLAGDRVRLKRSAGRVLELAEEAIVVGTYQGRLYYRIVSQKSEGGSLTEGGGRAWCWDESEVVDGLEIIGELTGLGIALPLMDRFRCFSPGGVRIVYEGGAVVRSDLEIFEGSMNLGSIPVNTILPRKDVLERRVNSCGVVRYRVRYNELEGWISSRIRGGKEEPIVIPVGDSTEENEDSHTNKSYHTPLECASEWYESFKKKKQEAGDIASKPRDFELDFETFRRLLREGVISDLSMAESDAFLCRAIGKICDLCQGGNPLSVNFDQLSMAISFALASRAGHALPEAKGHASINQVAAASFALGSSTPPSSQAILARVALLRAFNRRAKLSLPWLSLRPSQEGSALFGGMYGHGASIERAGRSTNARLLDEWIQVPTIASRIRSLRGLFFNAVKKDFLRGITDATTTPTPLSHDEYELPREIRTVRLNRLKARRAMGGTDLGAKRKHSVFAQLHTETKNWSGAALRRGFVAKGHGGQKRAFKVKLIGEGVNDYSGPYREAFTDSLAEVLSVESNSTGSLGVLDPTPNRSSQIGENLGLFMFSLNGRDAAKVCGPKPPLSKEERDLHESFASLTVPRDEPTREVEEALVFLGRITGTAFRHGIPLDLPLPMQSVWKAIVEEPSSSGARLKELDLLAHRHASEAQGPSGIVLWQQRMLNAFVEGLSNILPVEILSLLTGEELRDLICGNPEVDVDLLKRVVEYEGYEETDEVVGFFWETLREFTNEERKTFLQFVWARNRLPLKESDFEAPFKLQKDSAKSDAEQALPSASTCFFSLSLPPYKSKDQLKEKLLFAINNVTTMETDFQTNSAEIAEGYRAF